MKLTEAQISVLRSIAADGYWQAGRSAMAKFALARKGMIVCDDDGRRWLLTTAGLSALKDGEGK